MGSDDYGDYQQPSGGYAGGGSGGASTNYSSFQNPPSVYGQNEVPASSLTSGLGNGVNLQPSYYGQPIGNVDLGWEEMRKYSLIESVRIEIDSLAMDPSGTSGVDVSNATRWIKEAVSNGYAVIATFHSGAMLENKVAMDDENELLKAAAWWAKYYSTLRASGPFAINLMNEWGSHNIKPDQFAHAYNNAIAIVRSVYDGPIIVDIPGYGQEARTANLAITGTGNETIMDRKIILSTHIYEDAYNMARGRYMTKADLDELESTGLDCIVGEFGEKGIKGDADWKELVTYAKSKGWPVFGWAWNGDNSPAPMQKMNMIEPQFRPYVAGQQYTPTPYFDTISQLLEPLLP